MSDELSWKRWTPDDLSPPTAEFTPAVVSSDEGDAGAGIPELSEEEQRLPSPSSRRPSSQPKSLTLTSSSPS